MYAGRRTSTYVAAWNDRPRHAGERSQGEITPAITFPRDVTYTTGLVDLINPPSMYTSNVCTDRYGDKYERMRDITDVTWETRS